MARPVNGSQPSLGGVGLESSSGVRGADLVGADGRGAFERFARADAARTRTGGAGLGLALVEAIVAAHGGRVELRTAPGDSTIEVDLPAR